MSMMIAQESLVSALVRAFRGVDACHCEGDGKLSRDELLTCLVRYNVLGEEYAAPAQEDAETAWNRLKGVIGVSEAYDLKKGLRIQSLPALCDFTIHALLRCQNVGWKKAHDIELRLAREGYYLRDGDREALARELAVETDDADAADMRPTPKSPEETKAWAADWLAEMGDKLLHDGQSLIQLARRLDRNEERTSRELGMYAKARRFGHASVAKIAEMIRPLDVAAKATKRAAYDAAQAEAMAKRLALPAPAPAPMQVLPSTNMVAFQRRVENRIAAL